MVLEGARPSFVMNCWRRRFPTSLVMSGRTTARSSTRARRSRPMPWRRRGERCCRRLPRRFRSFCFVVSLEMLARVFPDFSCSLLITSVRDHNPPVYRRGGLTRNSRYATTMASRFSPPATPLLNGERHLPDDVLQRLLVGLPLEDHRAAASVCKSFRRVIAGPRFLAERRRCGFAERGRRPES